MRRSCGSWRSPPSGPCMKILKRPVRGVCMKALAGCSLRFLLRDLVRSSSGSLHDDLVPFSERS